MLSGEAFDIQSFNTDVIHTLLFLMVYIICIIYMVEFAKPGSNIEFSIAFPQDEYLTFPQDGYPTYPIISE